MFKGFDTQIHDPRVRAEGSQFIKHDDERRGGPNEGNSIDWNEKQKNAKTKSNILINYY